MTARIRPAGESDAGSIAAIYRPIVDATAISFETVPPTPDEMTRRIAETTRAHPWLVCDIDGHAAGYAYAAAHRARSAYRWSVDVSVYVASEHRQRGVGKGLYVSLLEILRAQGYVNAYAGITLPNPGSVALHESVGFRAFAVYERVGYKRGAWHDVGWWQLMLKPSEPSPREPLRVSDVREHPAWQNMLASGQSLIRASEMDQ